MKFMTKDDLIIRLRHMKTELFAVEEKIYLGGDFELIIKIHADPLKEKFPRTHPLPISDLEQPRDISEFYESVDKMKKGYQT